MQRNSSTSSSKSAAPRVVLFLGLVLAGMLLADVALSLYAQRRTSAVSFIEDARSKAGHMRLRLAGTTPDAIFVGSSRTIFHISTAEFAKAGLDIYNYGVSGCQIASYPSMVQAATEQHPKRIVISASVTSFGSNDIAVPDMPSFADIKAQASSGQSLELIMGTSAKLLTNLHKLGFYSQPLNLRLRNLFARLDRPITNDCTTSIPSKIPSNQIDTYAAPMAALDCTAFDSNEDRTGMQIFKCTNGDGVLIGHPEKDRAGRVYTWQGLAPAYVALLNHCLDLARNAGAQPILVLEPIYGFEGTYDLKAIRDAVHAPVIDFTRHPLPFEMWANLGHLNDMGRRVYSRALAKAFAALPVP